MRASAPAAACEQHSYFDVLDIRDPVSLPSREARICPFAIEARRRTAQERLIDIFERVDADHRVKTAVDPAGDDGHYAAARAGVELGGPGAERVSGYERGIFDHHLQSAPRIGGPHATVLGAKRAAAGASRNFGGIRLPGERERNVPAMALTVNEHHARLRRKTWVARSPATYFAHS